VNSRLKPAILTSLVFFVFALISISPNGYNTIQAAPKTFFEGLVLCLLCLGILAKKRNEWSKYIRRHDLLLLLPAVAFICYGMFSHTNTAAAFLHPTLIFMTLFCAAVTLRHVTRFTLCNGLAILALAVAMCGLLWFCSRDSSFSFFQVFQSTEQWTSDPSNIVRYPIFVANPFGGFAQKNIFSTLLATSALIIGYMYQQGQLFRLNKFLVILSSVTLLMVSYFIGLLGSLTASIGLVVGCFLLLYHGHRTRNWSYRSFLVFFCIIGGLLTGICDPFAISSFPTAVEKAINENSSTQCRILWWSFNMQTLFANPLIGSGLDSFSELFMSHAYEKKGVLDICDLTPAHSHNTLLHLASETGFVGLLTIAGPLILWLFITSQGTNFFAIASLLSPIALHSQTEWPLHASMLIWGLILLIPISLASNYDDNEKVQAPTKALVLIGLVLTTSYLMFTLTSQRGVAIERYLIETNKGAKRVELLINSRFRQHPAFEPVYDIAINKIILEAAIVTGDVKQLRKAIINYRRSIGPLAGHAEIKRLRKASSLLAQLDPSP